MVFIEIITGKAGCGKSYMLSKYINIASLKTNNWVVLAYTHSAVKNIEQYVKLNYPNINITNHFMTIHKYFNINFYDTNINIMNRSWEQLDYMFIDEFSLISIYLFTTIWPMIKIYVNKLVLCGDYRQLKPINSSDKILYDNLKKYLSLVNIHIDNIPSIQHFDNLLLSLDVVKNNVKKVINLTKQYRADSDVNNIIETLCFIPSSEQNKNDIKNIINKHMVKLSSVINLIKNNDYKFIASTYRQLRKINELINHQNIISIPILLSTNIITTYEDNIGEISIKLNDDIRITETFDDFQNGEIYKVVDVYNNCLIVKTGETLKQLFPIKIKQDNKEIIYYPVLPEYLLTFHKSQGMTINNVIVSLDNIFDFTMLYTGISRGRNNILFYTESKTFNYDIFDNIKTNYLTMDELFNKSYGIK